MEQKETVVSVTVFFALLGSLAGGKWNTHYGRKRIILAAAGIFTAGSLLLATAWNYPSLVLGRCIVGIAIGFASLTTPLYIAEVAPPSQRGGLVTLNGLLICLGQFSAGMVDGIVSKWFPNAGWRIMLGLAAVPSIIMGVGFLGLPESPRWLVMMGRVEEAL